MSKSHFVITGCDVLPDYRLKLAFADGQTFVVDLEPWIHGTTALQVLKDERVFAQARIGTSGTYIEWAEGAADLAADNLRNLAVEQAGGIGHERIWTWLQDTGLTLGEAADALGISRRMLIYYRDGEKPIPRSIWLACLGWEAIRPQGRLPLRIPSVREYASLHG